jgi:hypothetical protein
MSAALSRNQLGQNLSLWNAGIRLDIRPAMPNVYEAFAYVLNGKGFRMHSAFRRRLSGAAIAAAILFSVDFSALSGEALVSTMRNVNAVMESRGFRIIPAPDLSGDQPFGDEAPVFAVEIVRPKGEKITISRLFTSCSCVRLEADKQTFDEGERAVLRLRNVLPTPPAGQIYAMYVQVTGPIRTTLRYDTFVQSTRFIQTAAPVFTTPGDAGPDDVSADDGAEEDDDEPDGSETSELRTLDKYAAAPESPTAAREESEALKAAEALKEQKEREAREAGEAIKRTEELIKLKLEDVARAEELLERSREERKAASDAFDRAETALGEAIEADALRRRELLSAEEELESHKTAKELREREAGKAAIAVEALREAGD